MKDLRQFVEEIEKSGDLVRIKKEVDWEIEAGAISRRVYDQYGPCSGSKISRITHSGTPSLTALQASGEGWQ